MLETDRRNHEAYIRSGEIFEDRAQNYERLAKSWEKLWTGVQGCVSALCKPYSATDLRMIQTIRSSSAASPDLTFSSQQYYCD